MKSKQKILGIMELSKIKLRMRILCLIKKMLLPFSDNMLEYVILSPVIILVLAVCSLSV